MLQRIDARRPCRTRPRREAVRDRLRRRHDRSRRPRRTRGRCRCRATVGGDDHEANPGRGRARRRQLRRRDRAPARERDAGRTARDERPAHARRNARRRRPLLPRRRPAARTRRRLRLEPLELPQDYWIVLVLPNGAAKESTAAVYAAFDERGGGAGWEERRARLDTALAEVRRPRDLAALPPNDLASLDARRRLAPPRRLPRRRQRRRSAVYGLFHHRPQAEAARRALAAPARPCSTVPVWYG